MGKQRIEFFRESLRNLRSTGSVAPSSRFLCRALVNRINPDNARVVVELGPGDGVITRYILNRIPADARLIIFEINPVFVEKIHRDFDDARMTVIHDSAENMGQHFQALGIKEVDYFLSGIPFVMLPELLTRSIVSECYKWLRLDGWFLQFHYSPLLLKLYRSIFGNIDVEIVPFNIPPAIVVRCRRLANPTTLRNAVAPRY